MTFFLIAVAQQVRGHAKWAGFFSATTAYVRGWLPESSATGLRSYPFAVYLLGWPLFLYLFYFFILFSISSSYFIFYSFPSSCSFVFSMHPHANILFMLLGNKVDLFVLNIFVWSYTLQNMFQDYNYIYLLQTNFIRANKQFLFHCNKVDFFRINLLLLCPSLFLNLFQVNFIFCSS